MISMEREHRQAWLVEKTEEQMARFKIPPRFALENMSWVGSFLP